MLAVNVGGHLGFLTEPFELFQDTEAIWQRLSLDRYAVQKRMMLQAQLYEGEPNQLKPVGDKFYCLNEMCIKPASIDRMPTSILELEADGQVVDQYSGDGLLVSTPDWFNWLYGFCQWSHLTPWDVGDRYYSDMSSLLIWVRPLVLPPGSIVGVFPIRDRSN